MSWRGWKNSGEIKERGSRKGEKEWSKNKIMSSFNWKSLNGKKSSHDFSVP